MKKILCLLAILAVSNMAVAQSFNEGSYKSIGVYDTWEESPFRTGKLSGNVAVIKNHLYSETGINRTGHIIGVQRSRFGSNTFGARVDLNAPISIGRSGRYVHVLVYTPRASKVQVIGLGRRTTNTWNEGTDVEQFWSSPATIRANQWTDIVAQVKTNENVEIHSIVVVPDCASPHALTEDFVAYIDEIDVNSNSRARTAVTSTSDPYDGNNDEPDPKPDPDDGIYSVNFERTMENARATNGDNKYIRGITLTDKNGAVQRYPSEKTDNALTTKLYLDATAEAVFDVTAGESYTPDIDYKSDWMHAYAYVDYNRDGEFTNKLKADNRTVDTGSELVSYSAYATDYTGGPTGTYYNSIGTLIGDVNKSNTTTMPAFTIPADLPSGLYRMRLKIDWNNLDARGNDGSDGTNNQIWNNGGGIVDAILRVTGTETVSVASSSYRNGTIHNSEGEQITSTPQEAPYLQPYTVVMQPAVGFRTTSITAVYQCDSKEYSGYLAADTVTYTTHDDCYDYDADAFTLPASVMYLNVNLEPMYNNLPNFILKDTDTPAVVPDNLPASVTLQRSFSNRMWNSVCLPFDMNAEEIKASFGEKARVAALKEQGRALTFTVQDHIDRGIPYLLMPDFTDDSTSEISGIRVKYVQEEPTLVSNADVTFHGSYIPVTTPAGSYVMSKGDMYHTQTAKNMKGFRAYLTENGPSGSPLAFTVEDNTTGISDVDSADVISGLAPEAVYNLQGQRVESPRQQGIYVSKGRKIVR